MKSPEKSKKSLSGKGISQENIYADVKVKVETSEKASEKGNDKTVFVPLSENAVPAEGTAYNNMLACIPIISSALTEVLKKKCARLYLYKHTAG